MPTVQQVMRPNVVTVPRDRPVREVAYLLVAKRISGVPVVNGDNVLMGVLSLNDIVKHTVGSGTAASSYYFEFEELSDLGVRQESLQDISLEALAGDLMTGTCFTVERSAPLLEAVDLMMEQRIHRVIVTDQGRVVGILTTTDLMKCLRDQLAAMKGPAPA
ncbi:MAG: CBS domain-containing protein [Candidatus Eremiobacterota bacterium]